jgi:hypothetical protein
MVRRLLEGINGRAGAHAVLISLLLLAAAIRLIGITVFRRPALPTTKLPTG